MKLVGTEAQNHLPCGQGPFMKWPASIYYYCYYFKFVANILKNEVS